MLFSFKVVITALAGKIEYKDLEKFNVETRMT